LETFSCSSCAQDVEQNLGIGAGVDVAQILAEQVFLQLPVLVRLPLWAKDDAESELT